MNKEEVVNKLFNIYINDVQPNKDEQPPLECSFDAKHKMMLVVQNAFEEDMKEIFYKFCSALDEYGIPYNKNQFNY